MDKNFLNDTVRHNKAKPPEDAYYFFPNEFEIVEVDKKNPEKVLRRIFEGNNELLPVEKAKLSNLYQEIEKYNNNPKGKKSFIKLTFPQNWKEFDTLRFHQATNYKTANTIQLLVDHFEWRKSYFPFSLTPKALEILNSGFIYVHGRDCQFRPIFIINARYYVDNMDKYIYEDWLACIVYFMEYMIKNLLIPGQVENWNIITDVCGVSLLGLPKDMKRFMNVLQSNYRCRLFVNFIYGMGTFLGILWNMVKVFLDETSLKKIRMLKKGQFKDILALINPEQLEQKYGGTAPDVKENFFPPIMPSKNYLRQTDGKSKVLVSEKVYSEYLKTKVIVPSPYYLDKLESLSPKKSVFSDKQDTTFNTINLKEDVFQSEKLLMENKLSNLSIEKLGTDRSTFSLIKDEIENTNEHKGNTY
jgi:hypothetical protein